MNFMSAFFAAPLLLLGACRAQGQVVEDTLDWVGYFPLRIGDAWEYTDDNWPDLHAPKYRYWEVTRDTIIGERSYVVVQQKYYDSETAIAAEQVAHFRHDSTRAKVISYNAHFQQEEDYLSCGLEADFNQIYICDGGFEVDVTGNYNQTVAVGGSGIDVPAVKSLCYDFGPCVNLAYGVGDIGGPAEGTYNTITLTYARIDGIEYGTRVPGTATEERVSRSNAGLRTPYPTPASNRVFIDLTAPDGYYLEFTIYDLLGRKMFAASHVVGNATFPFAVDVAGWPSGVYFLRANFDSGRKAITTVVIAGN